MRTATFDTYALSPHPPMAATLAAHAETLSATWFEVSRRTLEVWPIPQPVVNNRRQPVTLDVWTFAAAHFDRPEDLDSALGMLPAAFSAAIRARLPEARKALAEHRAARSVRAPAA